MGTEIQIVVVGRDEALITRVCATHLHFRDRDGHHHEVVLQQCRDGWLARITRQQRKLVRIEDASQWDERCVGTRSMLSSEPFVELLCAPAVRFVFETRQRGYELLLDPLREHGWHTFDLD